MPNPLIPVEYLPAARLEYPWGKGGELNPQALARHGIFCKRCAVLAGAHCLQDCLGIMQPYGSRSQGVGITCTLAVMQQQVILMVNVGGKC